LFYISNISQFNNKLRSLVAANFTGNFVQDTNYFTNILIHKDFKYLIRNK